MGLIYDIQKYFYDHEVVMTPEFGSINDLFAHENSRDRLYIILEE